MKMKSKLSSRIKMKIKFVILIFFLILLVPFLYHSVAEARSGCCSHHGGVCSYKCPDDINVGYFCCDGSSLSSTCAPYYSSCPRITNPKPVPKIEPVIAPKTDYTTLNNVSAEVIRIVDGDTIEVKLPDGAIEKVRFIGIDTPETVDPRKPVECFGKEASAKMEGLVEDKTVRLERKENENRGNYGRLLRYVYVDNLFVNAEMIKQGYAYAYIKYPFDSKLMEEFTQYEKEAKEKELGLWSPEACAVNATQTNTSKSKEVKYPTEQDIDYSSPNIVNSEEQTADIFPKTENGLLWLGGIGAIGMLGYVLYGISKKKIKNI